MAPTAQQIQTALQALRDDAAGWRADADVLVVAARTAESLEMTQEDLGRICENVGIVSVYNQAQHKLVSLLNQGAQNEQNVANALITAANIYESEERAGVHKMNNVY